MRKIQQYWKPTYILCVKSHGSWNMSGLWPLVPSFLLSGYIKICLIMTMSPPTNIFECTCWQILLDKTWVVCWHKYWWTKWDLKTKLFMHACFFTELIVQFFFSQNKDPCFRLSISFCEAQNLEICAGVLKFENFAIRGLFKQTQCKLPTVSSLVAENKCC